MDRRKNETKNWRIKSHNTKIDKKSFAHFSSSRELKSEKEADNQTIQ